MREFADTLAAALNAGDVACVQLRLKDADDDAVRRATEVLLPLARAHEVGFIMNDRPDLAAETGCDGVHIGQEDAGYAEARRIVGADAIVGVTCHTSRHLAMAATVDHPLLGAFEVVGQGVSLGRTPFTIHAPPPEQGEHTDAILGKLGYDGEAIAGLHEDGVI